MPEATPCTSVDDTPPLRSSNRRRPQPVTVHAQPSVGVVERAHTQSQASDMPCVDHASRFATSTSVARQDTPPFREQIGAALSQVGLVSQDTGQTPAVLASCTQPGHQSTCKYLCRCACVAMSTDKVNRLRPQQTLHRQQQQATQGRSHPLHRLLHACESGLSREGGTRRGTSHTRCTTFHYRTSLSKGGTSHTRGDMTSTLRGASHTHVPQVAAETSPHSTRGRKLPATLCATSQ